MRNRLGSSGVLTGILISVSCSVDSGKDYSYDVAGAGRSGASGGSSVLPRGGSAGSSNMGFSGSLRAGGSSGASTTGSAGGRPSGGLAGTDGLAGAGDDIEGGSGGEPSTGGTTSSGGSAGATLGGTTTGGTGGITSTGGTGGKASTGGVPSTGGKASAGGVPSTGGTGGKASTGGVPSTGGKASTGGVLSTGGAPTVVPPSCTSLAAQCQGESCCTAIPVPGGPFKMGRSLVPTDPDYVNATADDETPEHPATVAAFTLDKYEVTVGRFRKFHAAYRQWHVTDQNPKSGAGLHPVAGRMGWGQSWTAAATDLPADDVALAVSLKCETTQQTWTDAASSPTAPSESYPINCVRWYTAFAFCVWDGGRLPTEAEWEFVAAGGASNYLHPWGPAPLDNLRANYFSSNATPYLPVGSKPAGAGTLGHLDLAGSMREWVFDWFHDTFYGTAAAPATCINCVNWQPTAEVSYRSNRGGSWLSGSASLRAADRWQDADPESTSGALGFRCAR